MDVITDEADPKFESNISHSTLETTKLLSEKTKMSNDEIAEEDLNFVQIHKTRLRSPKSPKKKTQKKSSDKNEEINLNINMISKLNNWNRKDVFGNKILKGGKQKVSFKDQLTNGSKGILISEEEIESFKAYNRETIKYSNNTNSDDNATTACSCSCVIF